MLMKKMKQVTGQHLLPAVNIHPDLSSLHFLSQAI